MHFGGGGGRRRGQGECRCGDGLPPKLCNLSRSTLGEGGRESDKSLVRALARSVSRGAGRKLSGCKMNKYLFQLASQKAKLRQDLPFFAF